MWINVTTVGDLLDEQAQRTSSLALVMPNVRLTYPELSTATDDFAASLIGLGVGRGDRVGILMPNQVEYVLALLAVAKINAVAVPINGRFKAVDAGYVIGHGDLNALLVASDPSGTDYGALVDEVFPSLGSSKDLRELRLAAAPSLRCIVNFGTARPGMLSGEDFRAAGSSVPGKWVKRLQRGVRVRDVAFMMYTSGTTAKPKGCLLTHEAVVRQGSAVARDRFGLTTDDAMWNPLPFFHCGGIIPMLGAFSTGATFCHSGHFEAGAALAMIERERCTVLYPAFETIWSAVVNHPEFANADLGAVRLVQNIASPQRLAQFEAVMPWAAQVSSYGSTECSTNLTLTLADDPYEARMNTLGKPVDGMELIVVDSATGARLGPNEMGELCFRGYSQFEGYYKDPEQTAASVDADGWFHSGDRGLLDVDGRLVYGGRIKDMLKVGGENVSPLEVEDFLAGHPAIGIVQVVAAPDARYGEVPAAFVELAPGVTLTEHDAIAYCVDRIATYKVPRYVRFVTEWPMSGTKIQKFVLRQRIADELRARGILEADLVKAHHGQSNGEADV